MLAYRNWYCCSQIDAASAKATVPTDKERILSDIQASLAARRRVGRCHVAAGHGVVTSPHGDCNSGGAGGDDDGDNGTFQGVSGDKGDGISAFNAALRCLLLLRPLDWRGELGRGTEAAAEAGAWVRGMGGWLGGRTSCWSCVCVCGKPFGRPIPVAARCVPQGAQRRSVQSRMQREARSALWGDQGDGMGPHPHAGCSMAKRARLAACCSDRRHGGAVPGMPVPNLTFSDHQRNPTRAFVPRR